MSLKFLVPPKKHMHVCLSPLVWIHDRVVLVATACFLVTSRCQVSKSWRAAREGEGWPVGLILTCMLYPKVLTCNFGVTLSLEMYVGHVANLLDPAVMWLNVLALASVSLSKCPAS